MEKKTTTLEHYHAVGSFLQALKGHGALCRLVILPCESHGYAARESIMHVLWETDRWLQKHCVSNTSEVSPDIDASNDGGARKLKILKTKQLLPLGGGGAELADDLKVAVPFQAKVINVITFLSFGMGTSTGLI
ncbi:probable glutamyl endopeptidase, chloroplastic [Hibiscus syriacus]|uniref:probable glutamyl endopeptidase, chloroplastic n=1 Tax=Hibiscus syriacus TaxID=106335 RepID=UPI001923520E|nr:probable glutamyl endopeptidase, chloroplastic [Hibiscus syriacus]